MIILHFIRRTKLHPESAKELKYKKIFKPRNIEQREKSISTTLQQEKLVYSQATRSVPVEISSLANLSAI
uniref:Uncharacterized protein n=1 Tax=Rhizophora mucronata TaxID=61149 RepID=A0A2P2QUQ1_RHIMU